MAKVLLIVFSGTGNTFLCAGDLKKHFRERGDVCDIYRFSMPLAALPNPAEYDLLGIGYPIHAFNTPLSFLRFLKHDLPKAHKPYFIFKVSGEPYHLNDASSLSIYRLLKKKGYSYLGERHFLMPYNIVFRYPDALAKEMVLYLDALTNLFVLDLKDLSLPKAHFPCSSRLVSFFFKIEWLAPSVNAALVKVDEKKCLHCGKCQASCPNQAIYQDKKGHLRINRHCSICMRCVDFCPVDAFHFGFLNRWKVVGKYDYPALCANAALSPDFIHPGMKGYFRHFVGYFQKADAALLAHHLSLPIKEEKTL
jgi:ferredoxin